MSEATDLCTLADVRLAMEWPDDETSIDDLATEYISEASLLIMKECPREFAPASTDLTRRFRMNFETSGAYRIPFAPYDLRNLTTVVLHPESDNSFTVDLSTDVELAPFVNSNGVYTSLMISPWLNPVSMHMLKFGMPLVDVTGDWGFETVPEPVKRACVVTVRTWLRSTATPGGTSIDSGFFNGPEVTPYSSTTYALPAAAKRMLQRYQRTLGAV